MCFLKLLLIPTIKLTVSNFKSPSKIFKSSKLLNISNFLILPKAQSPENISNINNLTHGVKVHRSCCGPNFTEHLETKSPGVSKPI